MRSIIILAIVLASSSFAFAQTTWYVPDNFPTIQGAISDPSVVDGDTVIVRPGTYVENIDFLGKAITLKSEQGSDVTVIDGNQAGTVVTCQSGEGPDSVLDGFTITNGSASEGGGMYNVSSNPTVTNCTFSSNWAAVFGGGMANDNSSPTVTNCTFSDNVSYGYPDGGTGGGMFNYEATPTVTNCIFTGNEADDGGGMYNNTDNPTVINCVFSKNYGGIGGGIYNNSASPTVTNCTFSENWAFGGAGIYNGSGSNPTMNNCIFWDDVHNPNQEITGSCTVTYSCVQGGYAGIGNIDAYPLFMDPLNNDVHLTSLSPCINRGTNNGAPSEDIDGDVRPYMGTVEMGADEFTGIHPLSADVFDLPVTGGTINLSLYAGSGNAWRNYLILGSLHGSAPGIPLPGGLETFRLNWDAFTDFMIPRINGPIFSYFLWSTDGLGRGSAQINAPPVNPNKIGKVMTYAYCLEGLPDWDFASNPVQIEFVP